MAKERITRRLKVYTTRIGIRDWAVAVHNQKEALKAWDVRENLFASGAARPVDDAAVIAAAMKTPGVPVSASGPSKPQLSEGKSSEAKSPAHRSNVVRLDERRAARTHAEPRNEPPPVARREAKKQAEHRRPAPPPDRSKLEAAEAELRELEVEIKVRRKEVARRKQELEREAESFETDAETRRRRLERQLEKARAAYERAKSS